MSQKHEAKLQAPPLPECNVKLYDGFYLTQAAPVHEMRWETTVAGVHWELNFHWSSRVNKIVWAGYDTEQVYSVRVD